MAEGFLRRDLRERFPDGGPSVMSAGTIAWENAPAVGESIEAASERSTDIRAHRARVLEPELVVAADLVIGMATEHADATTAMVPQSRSRSFTLKEAVRLLEELPALQSTGTFDEGALKARVKQAHGLRVGGFEGNQYDEDVVDPLGLSVETFRAVAWEIDTMCTRLLDGLLGARDTVAMSETNEEAGP
jgi:protein-tyrosine-phosphatase